MIADAAARRTISAPSVAIGIAALSILVVACGGTTSSASPTPSPATSRTPGTTPQPSSASPSPVVGAPAKPSAAEGARLNQPHVAGINTLYVDALDGLSPGDEIDVADPDGRSDPYTIVTIDRGANAAVIMPPTARAYQRDAQVRRRPGERRVFLNQPHLQDVSTLHLYDLGGLAPGDTIRVLSSDGSVDTYTVTGVDAAARNVDISTPTTRSYEKDTPVRLP